MLLFFTNLSHMEFLDRHITLFCLLSVIDSFEWFWMGSLHKIIQLMLEFLKAPFLVHYLYINDLPDDIIYKIAIYADDATLYSKCDQASDLRQQLELASELEPDWWHTVNWGRKWFVDLNVGKLTWFCLTGLIMLKLLMWKWMGLFFRKNQLLRCWDCLFLLNWIGALTLSLLLHSKKTGVLIHSMKFLSPEVALYLYKSTIRPCWNTVAMSGLVLLAATWNC